MLAHCSETALSGEPKGQYGLRGEVGVTFQLENRSESKLAAKAEGTAQCSSSAQSDFAESVAHPMTRATKNVPDRSRVGNL